MTKHVKRFGYMPSATAQVVPDQLKAMAILSDITVSRSAVDQEDLKPEKEIDFH